jgi:hypothetical protein
MNISQLAPTLRTTMQLGLFRLVSSLQHGWLPPGKLPLPGFAPRLLRMLHPFPPSKRRRLAFPRPLQFFHFCLQVLQQLLQSLNVQLQPLVVGSFPHQFQLQFGDPLIFRTGLGILTPFVTHLAKFTASRFLRLESFDLHFSDL